MKEKWPHPSTSLTHIAPLCLGQGYTRYRTKAMKTELTKFKKVADTIKSHTKTAEAKAGAKGKAKKAKALPV